MIDLDVVEAALDPRDRGLYPDDPERKRMRSFVPVPLDRESFRDAGLPVTDVSEFTGSPEVMDGRVKTLHPRVHGGILMRDTESDRAELLQLGGEPIEIVVVNLYPFSATVAKGAPFADCIENIDIGGPTMVRAAAKNHNRVTVAQHGQCAALPVPRHGSCASSGHT